MWKKYFTIFAVSFLISGLLVGCQIMTNSYEPDPPYRTNNTEAETPVSQPAPVNYMDEIKAEVHDELFREASEETLDIIDRIFKHLKIDTISSSVNGKDAVVRMNVTTVDAGKAWVVGLEKYAILCAENLFAETYADDATLYGYYLEEFENAVRKAEYITIPVVVEMECKNQRWEWDINDDVVNAITGRLLDAIEGEINSSNIVTVPEIEVTTPSTETIPKPVQPEQNTSSDVTLGMVNAAKEAASYLEFTSFSRSGLANQLAYEGYTEAEIEYALKFVGY